MGKMLQHTVLLVITVTVLFEAAVAIECYECNSAYDPRCGDPFDSFSLGKVNCSFKDPTDEADHLINMEAILCRKTSQKINGKIRVVRGCGYIEETRKDYGQTDCIKRTGTYEVQSFFCQCQGDLCNAGPVTTAVSTLLLVVLLALSTVSSYLGIN